MRKEEKERHITESTNIQLQIEIHHFGNVNVEIYVIGILLSFQKKKRPIVINRKKIYTLEYFSEVQ